jgi:FMN phosphatase YigB (HAD superfamily)
LGLRSSSTVVDPRQPSIAAAGPRGFALDRMTRNILAALANKVGQVEVVSSDVFDTLLLRTTKSERSRILSGERLFSDLLAPCGFSVPADILADVRIHAQGLAFRALKLRRCPGEVKLEEIVSHQLAVLGLPQSLVAERVRIEIDVEKASLVPNRYLADLLMAHRRAGARVVAISDTILTSDAVRALIEHFHGPKLVERVYSSADHGLTKRHGELFAAVAEAEGVPLSRFVHVGDDRLADVQIPAAKGVTVQHAPQPMYRHYLRRADGALTEARRLVRARARAKETAPPAENAIQFGRAVFGPIVTRFCLQIWLYAIEAETADNTALLFCARGGLGIREAFEKVLSRLSLPLRARRESFLISRLVAARAAILSRSIAAVEALDVEFRGGTFADVAKALGTRSNDLSEGWHRPFNAAEFLPLLFGNTGTEVLTDLEQQHAMFATHFDQVAQDADRIILCDTGLYGSTQRLLANGFPGRRIETVQFARANYKRHSEDHFSRVAGLVLERDGYDPFNVFSCVLRYWHLIESLFEPAVPSVRTFARDAAGEVTANCGNVKFGAFDPAAGNHLLTGVIEYIQSLPTNGGMVALRDAEVAWQRLKRAITRPTQAELKCLEVNDRSIDFGRPDVLTAFVSGRQRTLVRKMISLKGEIWREGAITREFPLLRHALLPALDWVQSLRGLSSRLT